MRKIGQKRGEKLNFGRQKGGEAVSDKFLALKYQRPRGAQNTGKVKKYEKILRQRGKKCIKNF